MTVYPSGYGDDLVSMGDLVDQHADGMEPEYERRLFAWIEAQGGNIGIGDGWRPYGSDTSEASAANKSFHQTQTFADDSGWFCAVDLVARNPGSVHRAPYWSEVPEQGSALAEMWGVHANVGGEPWHLQPVELDGFDSWVTAGRPRPRPGYPIPTTPEDDDMTHAPATVWCGPQLHQFVTGSDGALWHTWSDNRGAAWAVWESLEGGLASAPSAAVDFPRIDVAGVGPDGALYGITWDGTAWSGWYRIGDIP